VTRYSSSFSGTIRVSVLAILVFCLVVSCATRSTSSDQEVLQKSVLEYIPEGKNYWGGTIIQSIRMINKQNFPGSLVLSGRRATLETSGRLNCKLSYEFKEDTYKTFVIRGKGKIQREVFEAKRGANGPCNQLKYLAVGGNPKSSATTLNISWSRYADGSTKYYANFKSDFFARRPQDMLRCSELITAAYDRDLETVDKYVGTLGVDVNCRDDQKGSALWSSLLDSRGANRGRSTFDIVKYLVDNGADVTYVKERRSISHLAGFKGRLKSAAYIVANGGSKTEAEAGIKERKANDELFRSNLKKFVDSGIKAGKTIKKQAGGVLQDGQQQIDKDRKRLGVTAQLGVYDIKRSGKVTEVFCNRAPATPNTIRNIGDGKCVSSVWLGTYKCGELLRKTRNYCN